MPQISRSREERSSGAAAGADLLGFLEHHWRLQSIPLAMEKSSGASGIVASISVTSDTSSTSSAGRGDAKRRKELICPN
jgi:hypothetical protein